MDFKFGNLVFSSNFDSGNLLNVERVNIDSYDENSNNMMPMSQTEFMRPDYEFNVWTKPDCSGTEFENGNRTWFYFSVKGYLPGKVIKLTIKNLNRQQRLYSQGYSPLYKTESASGDLHKWLRVRTRPTWESSDNNFQLSFVHRFVEVRQSTTFFAFCYPWSYTECQNQLKQFDTQFETVTQSGFDNLQQMNSNTIYYHRELVIKSLEGRRVDLITISDLEGICPEREDNFDENLFPEKANRPWKFKNKRVFMVTSRVHPGETPASHVFNGFLDFILRPTDARSIQLRRQFIFKLIPLLNPDGVYQGHYRTDTRGVNLNRVYLSPSNRLHPAIYASKSILVYHHIVNSTDFQEKINLLKTCVFQNLKSQQQEQPSDSNCQITKSNLSSHQFNTDSRMVLHYAQEKRATPSTQINRFSQPYVKVAPKTLKSSTTMVHLPDDYTEVVVDVDNQQLDSRFQVDACVTDVSESVPAETVAGASSPSQPNKVLETHKSSSDQFCNLQISKTHQHSEQNQNYRVSAEQNDDLRSLQPGSWNEPYHEDPQAQLCQQQQHEHQQKKQYIQDSTPPTDTGMDQGGISSEPDDVNCFNQTSQTRSIDVGAPVNHSYSKSIYQMWRQSSTSPSRHQPQLFSHHHIGRQKRVESGANISSPPNASSIKQQSQQSEELPAGPPTLISGSRKQKTSSLIPLPLRPAIVSMKFAASGRSSGLLGGRKAPVIDQAQLTRLKRQLQLRAGGSRTEPKLGNEGSDEEGSVFDEDNRNVAESRHLSEPGLLEIDSRQSGVAFYIDLHGHCSKRGCFVYGNSLQRDAEMIDNLTYAKLISLNSAHFDFGGCNFSLRNMYTRDKRDGTSKEGAGRVAVWKHLGLVHSYTLECNYNTGRIVNTIPMVIRDDGQSTPPLNDVSTILPPRYTPSHYEDVGKAMAIAALDMSQTNPWSRIPGSELSTLTAVREFCRKFLGNSRVVGRNHTLPNTGGYRGRHWKANSSMSTGPSTAAAGPSCGKTDTSGIRARNSYSQHSLSSVGTSTNVTTAGTRKSFSSSQQQNLPKQLQSQQPTHRPSISNTEESIAAMNIFSKTSEENNNNQSRTAKISCDSSTILLKVVKSEPISPGRRYSVPVDHHQQQQQKKQQQQKQQKQEEQDGLERDKEAQLRQILQKDDFSLSKSTPGGRSHSSEAMGRKLLNSFSSCDLTKNH